jgi:alanyl-tRNA synthetase
VALLGSSIEGSSKLVFCTTPGLGIDVSKLMAAACRVIGGRGGGKPEMAQGGGPDVEKLREALKAACALLR